MASVSVVSPVFTSGLAIPIVHRYDNCGGENISPPLEFILDGILPYYINRVQLYCEDMDMPDTTSTGSPTDKKTHWRVDKINPNQRFIGADGEWVENDYGDPNPISYSVTGSNTQANNGWTGVCEEGHHYRIVYRVEIKKDYIDDVGGNHEDHWFEGELLFTLDPIPELLCDVPYCDNNDSLIEEGVCVRKDIEPAVMNDFYGHGLVASLPNATNDWGSGGTRFYANTNGIDWPLVGSGSGLINDDVILESAWVPLPFTLNTTDPLWWHANTSIGGRLANTGVDSGTVVSGHFQPQNETLGMSKTIHVVDDTELYCVGIAGSDRLEVRIDGVAFMLFLHTATLTPDNHKNIWHVVEIELTKGKHIIEFLFKPLRDWSGFAYELYKASAADLMLLTTETELYNSGYLVGSSKQDLEDNLVFNIGTAWGQYECGANYAYDNETQSCIRVYEREDLAIDECTIELQNCITGSIVYVVLAPGNDVQLGWSYLFTGEPILEDGAEYFDDHGFCWKVLDINVITDMPIFHNITPVGGTGIPDCCHLYQESQNCETGEQILHQGFTLGGGPDYGPLLPNTAFMWHDGMDIVCAFYIGYILWPYISNLPELYIDLIENAPQTGCAGCTPGPVCYKFINCQSPFAEIIVTLLPVEIPLTPAQIGNVFNLSLDTPQGTITGCFKYVEETPCPDIVNTLTTIEDTGCTECAICGTIYQLTNCITGAIETVHWDITTGTLDEGQVYTFDFIEGCWTSILLTTPCSAWTGMIYDQTNIVTLEDDCSICEPDDCYTFKQCDTGNEITTSALSGISLSPSDIGNMYNLIGIGAVENTCYELISIQSCDGNEATLNGSDKHCIECSICIPYYKLTNCEDSADVHYVYWHPSSPALSVTSSYIFDFLDDAICYAPILLPYQCEENIIIYDDTNIITEYISCNECTARCYKLTDCITGNEIIVSNDFSGYLNQTIGLSIDDGEIQCTWVEEVLCREEKPIELTTWSINGCFTTCEDCQFVPVIVPEEHKRVIKPGYEVPPCAPNKECDCTTNTCNDE